MPSKKLTYSPPDIDSETISDALDQMSPEDILEMIEYYEGEAAEDFPSASEVDLDEFYAQPEDDKQQEYIIDSLTWDHDFRRVHYDDLVQHHIPDSKLFGFDFSPRKGVIRWVSKTAINMIMEAAGDPAVSLAYISEALEMLEQHGTLCSYEYNGGFSFTYWWPETQFEPCPEEGHTISLLGLDLESIAAGTHPWC
jgi:hypothetical protein